MSNSDLRSFVRLLDEAGELARIREPVSTFMEIPAITHEVSMNGGPALLFERVKECPLPVLTNTFGSLRRLCLAMGIENLRDLDGPVRSFLEGPSGGGGVVTIGPHPCQEVVITGDDVDLGLLPLIHAWPGDGGPAITMPVVMTRHPETGETNLGIYRMQVFDKRTTGMHWRPGSGGDTHMKAAGRLERRLEVAVAIGTDPFTTIAAASPLPAGGDERAYAALLRGAPVPLARCMSVDLQVPASSEIVLEGYVDPAESRMEGPFANHTGYYDVPAEFPVFHVTAMTRRRDALYQATIVGRPPQEDCFIAKASERLVLARIRLEHPQIRDIELPVEGIFQNAAILTMEKRVEGEAKRLIAALARSGPLSRFKFLCVFDADLDPKDPSQVVWRLLNHLDPLRDVIVSEGFVNPLDPASQAKERGGRIGLDCTRKLPGERDGAPWPEECRMKDKVLADVRRIIATIMRD